MIGDLPELGLLALFAVMAAISDVVTRRIPNFLSLLCGVCGLVLAFLDHSLPSHAAHMALALLIGMILFRFGVVGGGDAKFYAGVATFFPLSMALPFGLSIAVAGVALMLVFMLVKRLQAPRRDAGSDFAKLPYGVAIALGAVATQAVLA